MVIVRDSSGDLWLGTYGGGIVRFNPSNIIGNKITSSIIYNTNNQLNDNIVISSLRDKNSNLWFGTGGGGITIYNWTTKKFINYSLSNGLADDNINCIFQANDGIVWVGTDNGLSRLDPTKISINNISITNYSEVDGISNNKIRCITEDSNGTLWLATHKGFTKVFNNKDKVEFTAYTDIDGLLSNTIYVVAISKDIELEKEVLWLGTNKGASKVEFTDDYRIKTIRNFSKREGFAGIECNGNAITSDYDGNIWFGTVKGVIKYNPTEDHLNLMEPITNVSKIKLFFKDINWLKRKTQDTPSKLDTNYFDINADYISVSNWNLLPDGLKLDHTSNHITFGFNGVSFITQKKVQYQFRLTGVDQEWSPATFKSEVTYTNLSPGEYEFKVKACNSEGVWNKVPSTYRFSISPPYWETAWYFIVQILFFTILIGVTLYISSSGKRGNTITVLVFICLFVIFEFIQNYFEPYYEDYIGSATLVKTLLNLVLASLMLPAQNVMRKYLLRRHKKQNSAPTET